MNSTSLCLLHQDPTTLLTTAEMKKKILHNLSFIINEIISALQAFSTNQLSKFDPHVGETACQIRAYMVFLFRLKLNDPYFSCKLRYEITKMQALDKLVINEINNFHFLLNKNICSKDEGLHSHIKICDFLTDRNLVFPLSFEIKFLLLCYFLTRFKDYTDGGDHITCYERICHEMQISRKLSKKIVRHYQIQLANISTQFILDLSQNNINQTTFTLALKHLTLKDDDERSVLPCYLVMKVLLQSMLTNKCPILIEVQRQHELSKIDHIHLIFFPNSSSSDYSFHPDSPGNLNHLPCVVIQGLTIYESACKQETKEQFISRFTNIGLIKIVLANMANHPQFSGNRLKDLIYNPYKTMLSNVGSTDLVYNLESELFDMRNYGQTVGCCETHPSLFFIRHIFCNTIGEQINKTYGLTKHHIENNMDLEQQVA